ncbi:hypothetical protein HUT16_22080 [Kitasatospora sp. NA04385]|uniref:hypothetical protein n=1 Tax=Kitasatospora sp. NA04385 TaxID=2742135 RepID=UPI00159164D4|nr:hypothetical protein [Kitasatospora sp. NA04385]QKW21392.1 hypothetical protein HUT16_22080 [Kitasatospora sp. NA04385]
MKKKTRLLIAFAIFVALLSALLLSGAEYPPPYVAMPAVYGGLLAGNLLTQSALTLLGRPAGLVPTGYGLGVGRMVRVRRLGGAPLALRSVPLPLVVCARLLVPAPRPRAWAAVTAAYVPALVLGGWLVAATRGGWQLFGLMTAGLPLLEVALQSRFPGCPGWVVLRLPTASPALLAEAYASPAQLAAARALLDGRPADAVAALAAEPAGGTLSGDVLRVRALLAAGAWEEALERAGRIVPAAPVAHLGWAADLARAEALVCAADAGLLPPADYLPRLAALTSAFEDHTRRTPVRADLLRLRGEREAAVKAADRAVGPQLDLLSVAGAECSLAAALLAAGRPEQAARALDRARRLSPGLARIALVERRAAAVVLEGPAA